MSSKTRLSDEQKSRLIYGEVRKHFFPLGWKKSEGKCLLRAEDSLYRLILKAENISIRFTTGFLLNYLSLRVKNLEFRMKAKLGYLRHGWK